MGVCWVAYVRIPPKAPVWYVRAWICQFGTRAGDQLLSLRARLEQAKWAVILLMRENRPGLKSRS